MGMFSQGTVKYGGELDITAKNSPHVELLKMVGPNKRVLEIGPGIGHVTKLLKQYRCDVTCVERDSEMADRAKEFCTRIIMGDIESSETYAHIAAERFDVITFGDVLEHLRDPVDILIKMRRLLSPNGYLVASIPNVAHRSLRLSLLFGEFNYADAGLLDRTHLRFFTRTTIEQMMTEAGFRIADIIRIRDTSLMDTHLRRTASVSQRIFLEAVKVLFRALIRGEGLTYQFVIKATTTLRAESV
jgi:2-polyprenyl-3-methyl-5-hydroxy-6-metoxy-1,4-benzoquinol methylase